MRQRVRKHWPEYFIEASCPALFMMAACGFGTLTAIDGSGKPDGALETLGALI